MSTGPGMEWAGRGPAPEWWVLGDQKGARHACHSLWGGESHMSQQTLGPGQGGRVFVQLILGTAATLAEERENGEKPE